MADRNINKQFDSDTHCVSPPVHTHSADASIQPNMDTKVYNVNCSNSPLKLSTGDSGYNTDFSPSSNKPQECHFFLKDFDSCEVLEVHNKVASQFNVNMSSHSAELDQNINSIVTVEQNRNINSIVTLEQDPHTESTLTVEQDPYTDSAVTVEQDTNINSLHTVEQDPNINSLQTVEQDTNINSLHTVEQDPNINSLQTVEEDPNINSLQTVEQDTNINNLETMEQVTITRSPVRLSEVIKTSPSPITKSCRATKVSESSDTNQVQFDFESDDEDNNCENVIQHLDQRENQHILHFSEELDIDDNGYENTDQKYNDVRKNWDSVSEPQTPRCRGRRYSSDQLKHYSGDNYHDDIIVGASGGFDLGKSTEQFNNNQLRHSCSDSLQQSSHSHNRYVCSDIRTVPNEIDQINPHNDIISCRNSNSSLTGSQGFLPGYVDSGINDSDSALTCSSDSIEAGQVRNESQIVQGASRAVTILRGRSNDLRIRRRRIGVVTNSQLTSELIPMWPSHFGAVSVSTQTPHVTSVMIQKVIETPTSLPNQARGRAASRLHRLSEANIPFSLSLTPLPDIIPSVGRDRSLSVPNLHAFPNSQMAREVGQELRRLSDEFNLSRNLAPVNEEFDGHPASYPRRNSTYLRSTFIQFGVMLRDRFRGRSNT